MTGVNVANVDRKVAFALVRELGIRLVPENGKA
jgi:hypothetical protein